MRSKVESFVLFNVSGAFVKITELPLNKINSNINGIARNIYCLIIIV